MASRAWPHEPTTSTFALVTALRSLTAVVIVADMAQASAFVGLVAGSGTSTGSPAWGFW
jgi:hypothetical protein